MESGTIFYIIAILAYFIYTTFIQKKPEKTQGPTDDEMGKETDQVSPKKGVSFEEMLREIRNEQVERESDLKTTGESKDEEVGEQEEVPYQEVFSEPLEHEEESYKNPYRELGQPLVKLDDQVDINDNEQLLGDVEDVAEEYQGRSKYASMLKNPEHVKDAVILSEILNRRHF
ncbi:MAG: hypothetical protein WDZ72_11415 [Cyclobacteriaceae bacterium]